MDPNATLADLIDAAVAGDTREIRDAAFRLIDWLRSGGFTPDDPRDQRRLDESRPAHLRSQEATPTREEQPT